MRIEFDAPEYQADTSFKMAAYAFEGSPEEGWKITRDGQSHLELGPGYRLLRTIGCGVCSTDLARHFLPFPLPQVTGHEIVARDDDGNRYAAEINATFAARGVPNECPFCWNGLHTHSPERLVLGIHDLPGGFGPWVLVPVKGAIPVPDEIEDDSAVLIEPLAAALNAVTTIEPRRGDRVAVLGPRRLGMLVVAALAAHRARSGVGFSVTALARRQSLLDLAATFGADDGRIVEGDGSSLDPHQFDVVIDTTGSPAGFDLAVDLASREVHVKSTHGQSAGGIEHLTEMVVDEIAVAPFPTDLSGLPPTTDYPLVAWTLDQDPPKWLRDNTDLQTGTAADVLARLEANPPENGLPRADLVVVAGAKAVDEAIRPEPGREVSLVAPRGCILVVPDGTVGESSLVDGVLNKGLIVSTSRCGDFRDAIDLMMAEPSLRDVGRRLITHQFDAAQFAAKMGQVFEVAGSPDCIKAVVWRERGEGPV